MMTPKKPSIWNVPIFSNLFGFASISTAVLSLCAVVALNWREWNIRQKPYYKQTMEKWKASETAKYLIGEPISLKYVQIFDRSNYLGEKRAIFFIPFKGQRYNGKMNVNATVEKDEWTLNELSLELDGDLADKKLIVYRKEDKKFEDVKNVQDNKQGEQKSGSQSAKASTQSADAKSVESV